MPDLPQYTPSTPTHAPGGSCALAPSEYIGENVIRVFASSLLHVWERKESMQDFLRPHLVAQMRTFPHDRPRLRIVNSFSLAEFEAAMVAAAFEAFEQIVREFENGQHRH